MEDLIVNEVRKSREAVLEKFGGNLNRFFKYLREEESKNPEKLAKLCIKRAEKSIRA